MRAELDEINLGILHTLEARGRLVREIMELKGQLNMPAYDPDRERRMLQALLEKAESVYPQDALERIFGAIFAACRSLTPRR